MKFMMKFKALFAFIMVLGLVLPVAAVNADEVNSTEERLNYLALGDSLAAGMNDQGAIAKGYADYFAIGLQEAGELNYNKGFAVPGYKTTNILEDLKSNVQKRIYNLEGEQEVTVDLNTAVKEADVITISVGANDVLAYIKKDPQTGQFKFDLQEVAAGIKSVGQNYHAILSALKQINPEVEIFVMGYYNPYPTLEAYTQQFTLLVNELDKAVGQVTEANGGHFVKVVEEIAADYKTHVPNPANIHLSDAGYQVVGNKFLESFATLADEEEATEEPIEGPVFTDLAGHWSAEYVKAAVEYGVISGFEDGTFKPNQAVNRIQIVSIIGRSLEVPGQAVEVPFVDISNYSEKIQAEVAKVAGLGIVVGEKGYFKPEDKVTRAQLAVMISRAYTATTGETYVPKQVAPFKDIAGYNEETQNAITLLYDLGIVQGTGNGAFSPSSDVTRAQAAKIILGFLTLPTEQELVVN
ncbi:S-layer homology domain-containing protein [Lysinibacillus antri]|uniref:Endoglucanase n=1 Tax=Lysinibacillus antri TaxID=2498145 RepID=A0A432LB92_9BACI|nr:S-layer homology domain-containing protein [Lysinibacillus antri]RUL51735.1 endoglucanase [Lysinibacillus antri]